MTTDPKPAPDLLAPRDREDERLLAEQHEAEEIADGFARHSDHLFSFVAPTPPKSRDEQPGPYHPGQRDGQSSPGLAVATSSDEAEAA